MMKHESTFLQSRQFVGRTEELALLGQAVVRLREGQGSAVLLSGEPGIGKSRLAQELALRAATKDVQVHWGFCWEAGDAPAYWPWQQALGEILQSLPPEMLNAMRAKIQPLRRILPGLLHTEGDAVESGNAEVARFQFLSAVTSLLSAAAQKVPLLLILEDLHAADEDSVILFQHVAKHCSRLSLLLIGTFRESDARFSAAGPHLWRAMRQAWEIRLGHLSYAEVRAYLQARAKERVEDWIESLWEATEGNPLYVVQLVDLLLSRTDATGGRDLTRQIPDGIKAAIRERASALPSSCAELLATSSVFGREFSSRELAAICSLDTGVVEERLLPAVQASLLQQKSPGEYRFAHILIREVLHEGLALSERRLLHKKCAARLEEQRPINWPQLAQHLRESGPEGRSKAVEAWRRAAREAEERAAFRHCASCWENALEVLGQGPSVDSKVRLSLLIELGRALIRAGELQPGRQRFLEAFQLARLSEDAEAMAEAALGYGSVFLYAQVDPKLIALLQEALSRVGEQDSLSRAKLQARLASAMQPAADPSEPIARAREAIAMARRLKDPDTLRITLRFAISALMDLAPPQERQALNREHIQLAEKNGDDLEIYRGYLRLFIDNVELGEPEAMRDALAACERIAEKTGLPHYRWQVAACRGMCLAIYGRRDRQSHGDGGTGKRPGRRSTRSQRADHPDHTKALLPLRLAADG